MQICILGIGMAYFEFCIYTGFGLVIIGHRAGFVRVRVRSGNPNVNTK